MWFIGMKIKHLEAKMAALYLLDLAGLETIHGRDSEICEFSQMDISHQASSTPSHEINSKI
jgi:hypothetical protein